MRLCPLHLLLVWQLSPALCLVISLWFICKKETLPFRRLYHKLTNHLTLETPPPRCFVLILPLFLRKAPPLASVQLFKYNLFFARVGGQGLSKVFVCRTDVVREMTSKRVLDLARVELKDYFTVSLTLIVYPLSICIYPSANVLANVRCVVQNSTPCFWEHSALESKTSRFVQMVD